VRARRIQSSCGHQFALPTSLPNAANECKLGLPTGINAPSMTHCMLTGRPRWFDNQTGNSPPDRVNSKQTLADPVS